jgi:hypothetical protein
MIFYKVGYNQYNVFANICNKEMLVATITPQLIGFDKIYLNMYLPYEDCSEKQIKIKYITTDEMIEKAKKIIIKKLYKMQNDIIHEMKEVNFDNNTQRGKYGICNYFSHGNVYAKR